MMKENVSLKRKERFDIVGESGPVFTERKNFRQNRLKTVAVFMAVVLFFSLLLFLGGEDSLWNRFIAFALDQGFMHYGGNDDLDIYESFCDPCESEVTELLESEAECSESESLTENENTYLDEYDKLETDEDSLPTHEEVSAKDYSESDKGVMCVVDKFGVRIDVSDIKSIEFTDSQKYYSESPVVMILHTHTGESYYDSDPENATDTVMKGVVAIGDAITSLLNSKGVPAVHCTVIHDGEPNSDSYKKAAETIKTMLKIYPTIKYVIDVHRNSDSDESGSVIKSVSGVNTAQIQMTVGSESEKSRLALNLALNVRSFLNSNDKKLSMPVVFSNSLYLSGMTDYYIKLCVGTDGNDFIEAYKAAQYFADAFVRTVKK